MNYQVICIAACVFMACLAVPAESAEKKKDGPIVLGWCMSPHETRSQYATMRNHSDVLTHISPTRIAIADSEGTVRFGKDNYILSHARQTGMDVFPLVANGGFSKELAHAVLSDPAKRTKVVNQLLKVIQRWDCPGINIDLENIGPEQRQNLNAFMKELADVFHPHGLIVTIDVAAKTHDAPTSGWAGVYDYEYLGEVCDYVMLMCYDEHWAGGSAGPIGSIPWVRKVLEYAVSVIPNDKVVLGVPFYGRDWPEKGRARSLTSKSAAKLLEETQATLQWDNINKSHWFQYETEGGTRTAYFESTLSMKNRISLAQEFGIGGIAIWRLGDEDPEFFNLLGQYRQGRKVL